MMTVEKPCVCCKSAYNHKTEEGNKMWFCKHEKAMQVRQTDLDIRVFGRSREPTPCYHMRKDGMECGADGELWEQAAFDNFWQQMKAIWL